MEVKLLTINVKSTEFDKAQLARISWASGEVRIEFRRCFLKLINKIRENLSKGPSSETAGRRFRWYQDGVYRFTVYRDFLDAQHDFASHLEVTRVPHVQKEDQRFIHLEVVF